MGAIPLFLVVLAHFFLPGEPLTLPKAAGFLLGFAGIVVLIGPEALFTLSLSGEELIGEAAILLACLSYAVHGIAAKRMGMEDPVEADGLGLPRGRLMGLGLRGRHQPIGPSRRGPGGRVVGHRPRRAADGDRHAAHVPPDPSHRPQLRGLFQLSRPGLCRSARGPAAGRGAELERGAGPGAHPAWHCRQPVAACGKTETA